MLALGGLRVGSLDKLQYRHIRKEYESEVIPRYLHIETEITKGKYHDYDTFIGSEAVEYLKIQIRQL